MGESLSGPARGPPTYEYDIPDDEAPSTAVVLAVHEYAGRPIPELGALGSLLSADALDELCASFPAGPQSIGGRVEFSYEGFTVRIVDAETVQLWQ